MLLKKWWSKLFSTTYPLLITKFLVLFGTFLVSAFIILTFYRDVWGWGEWNTGSSFVVDNNGNPILISNGPGPGQWRLKQLIITLFGGGALGVCGLLLQKTTRNPLAEVSILGIGSINILFIFAYVFIFQGQAFAGGIVSALLPLVTIFASLLGTLLIWIIARSKHNNKNTFVIIGIALQLLFEAIAVVFVNPNQLSQTNEGKQIWNEIKNYTMGNVAQDKMPFWLIISASIIISFLIALAMVIHKKVDLYELSPTLSVTLGVRTERLRISLFTIVALIAGIEAALLGNVALLGIIAPSLSRRLFGNRFIILAFASFLIGGTLVMVASIISINFGADLPIGILATAIVSPYFLWLTLRRA